MAKYIAIFNDVTSEEITVNGFIIMTEKQMNSYEELASSITWDFDYKEDGLELNYINGEDLLDKIEFKELSVQEASLIKKLFGAKFGYFIDEELLFDVVQEEGEEEMDEDNDDDEGYGVNDNYSDDDDY
jgi:hypothetical protein